MIKDEPEKKASCKNFYSSSLSLDTTNGSLSSDEKRCFVLFILLYLSDEIWGHKKDRRLVVPSPNKEIKAIDDREQLHL